MIKDELKLPAVALQIPIGEYRVHYHIQAYTLCSKYHAYKYIYIIRYLVYIYNYIFRVYIQFISYHITLVTDNIYIIYS